MLLQGGVKRVGQDSLGDAREAQGVATPGVEIDGAQGVAAGGGRGEEGLAALRQTGLKAFEPAYHSCREAGGITLYGICSWHVCATTAICKLPILSTYELYSHKPVDATL